MKDLPKIILLMVVLLCVAACESDSKGQRGQQTGKIPATVEKVTVKDVTQWDEYTGRFRASEQVDVRARVSGFIEAQNFIDGQRVEKGDVLFIIDQRPFEIALSEAEAELSRAEAQYQLSITELGRAEKLRAKKAVSEEEYSTRANEKQVTAAAVQLAQGKVNDAKLELEFTEVTAPISGRVSRDFVNVGNLITGGAVGATVLTTIVRLQPIHFYFEASEAELLKYTRLDLSGSRPGSRDTANPLEVKLLDEDSYRHKGVMDFVDNVIDPATGTIQGRAVFKNKNEVIQPGMFARARLLGKQLEDAVLVPDKVISSDQSRKYVLRFDPKTQTAERTFVELGRLFPKGLRLIESGLSAEDQIVTGNLMKIRPGAKIKPLSASSAQLPGKDQQKTKE